jgi:serine protease Do
LGKQKEGWLGVRIQVVTEEIADIEKLDEPRGALVASVAQKSPSDKAGIEAGDIILEFNGTRINEMKELPIIVAQTEVGKTVNVKIWRNKKEINKKIKLGRLETSSDFKEEKKETKKETPEISEIKSLKIIVRLLNQKDIEQRELPNQTTGLVITNIGKNSPVNYLNVGDIIVEAQKKKIRSIKNLEDIVDKALESNQKTILIVIYNSQNQRRYIGVKLD